MSNGTETIRFVDAYHASRLANTDVGSADYTLDVGSSDLGYMRLNEGVDPDDARQERLTIWTHVGSEFICRVAKSIHSQSIPPEEYAVGALRSSDMFENLPPFIGRHWDMARQSRGPYRFITSFGDMALVYSQEGATTRSVDVSRPGLLTREVDEQLVEMARLSPNWDLYGAIRISKVAIRLARLCLARLPSSMGSPTLAPVADGSVSIVWEQDDTYLEIETNSSGRLAFYGDAPNLGEHELHGLELGHLLDHDFFIPYKQAVIAT